MTTPRPAHEGHSSDRETLTRVLERLRDLPERPTAGHAPDLRRTTEVGVVPLPRRRPERWAPSVD